MVRCAHRTCEISSIQSLLPLSNRAFVPSPKLLFALSTKPLACGCLMEAKHWRIFNFSHQSLNGLSLNYFPLLDIISPGPWPSSHRSHSSRKDFLYKTPLITAYRLDLSCTAIAFFFSARSVSSVRPAIRASYSASLLVALNSNLRASSSTSMGAAGESSSGLSTMKSAKICPLIDTLGM
ncbi:hypothetical protein Tco_0955334 [Tanacetum coccineum]|uniref:Uncharacterized protein n=1 Tax=Tanacetum coccineum TaxID=301880 RepID=A0ABQ5E6X0_9ASTR